MKCTLPVRLILSLTLFLTSFSLQAQENATVGPEETQMFAVWEITVSPANTPKVIAAWKNATAKMTEHDVAATFGIMTVDDGRFLISSPIENLAQLDQDPMADMAKTIGREGMMEIFQPIYDNAITLNSYVIEMPKEKSYFPSDDPREGANYRKWVHYSFEPTATMMINDLAEKVMALNQKYKVPGGFVMYRDGLGMIGPKVIVEYWGKSTSDLYVDKTNDLPEEYKKEQQALNAEIAKHLVGVETFMGYYHEDLSYEGPADMAKKDE